MTPESELPVTDRRLWAGVLLAPGAWVVAELLGYYLASRSCEPIPRGVPLGGTSHPAGVQLVLAVALAALAAGGLATAIGNWRAVGPRSDREQPVWGRARFMASGGMIAGALFLCGI